MRSFSRMSIAASPQVGVELGWGGSLQEQSVLVSCLVVGAFVYVSEGSSANLCMCVN